METNILSVLVFLPLVLGFVLLLLPNSLKSLSKAVTVVVSVAAFIMAIKLFGMAEPPSVTWN